LQLLPNTFGIRYLESTFKEFGTHNDEFSRLLNYIFTERNNTENRQEYKYT